MTFYADTDHAAAVAAFAAAGHDFPEIPFGQSAIWRFFTTVEGQHAIIINQGGHERFRFGDGEETNGCTLVVALDEADEEVARNALEEWVIQMLVA